ncbi:MAG: hypothetical protein L6V81_02795 [Clostridium sp.]|nr:MAG: hypothetical protein L6V81_02795 [Clostridium sp.]
MIYLVKTIIPYATNAGWLGKNIYRNKKSYVKNSKVESEMNIVFESYSNELVTSKSDIDKWINDIKRIIEKKAFNLQKNIDILFLYNFITFYNYI